ncbi:MAG: TonB-dependent receptor [Saprospiraceae bacterium]|nr:TonB-dependent receptor [Saprospiraceae bacterium]
MKTKYLIILILLMQLAAAKELISQTIKGVVYELGENAKKQTLPGVNLYWAGTTSGAVSNSKGEFILKTIKENPKLVVSFVGYKNDTVLVAEGQKDMEIILSINNTLKEVVITNRLPGGYISRVDAIYNYNITGHELGKAACCNLGESFETNASVDVSFSDAVSGAKQIQLLGLAGVYSQMMTENIPNLYGLATSYSLGYIPGSWMESIQISKGTSSVLDGFSSITGQINVNHKLPDKGDKLYLNALINDKGKIEGNANTRVNINERLSTILFLHAENSNKKNDANGDMFIDQPLINQYNIMNKWKYFKPGGQGMFQFGFHVIDEERSGGQNLFDETKKQISNNFYGIHIKTRRYQGFAKGGYEFKNNINNNIAVKTSATYHSQESLFGKNRYNGVQKSAYSNVIFQSYIKNLDHKFSTGASFAYDDYDESLNDSVFKREEIVPGAFFQYTFEHKKLPIVLVGIRADHHNIYGTFFTPRLHIRYKFNENNILRLSGGKGYRSANVIAENSFLLASSRNLNFLEKLKMEEAINYGVNFTKYIPIKKRELVINADFYRTDFINQVVIDMDQDVSQIYFYNLDGKSYSNNYQIELKYEPIKRLDVVLAYRYTDVKTTINNDLIRKPLTNKYKGLFNVSYYTNLKKWQFDFTAQFNGDTRLPGTENNPVKYQRGESSPAYTIFNAQVTKYFRRWNVYFGGENLTDFTQNDPIIAADDPFGQYFDASQVWGPLVGRKFYLGVRFNIDE